MCSYLGASLWMLAWCILPALAVLGQGNRPLSIEARLDYDTFFGPFPTLALSRERDSTHAVRLYTTFYPTPAFFGSETGINVLFKPSSHWLLAPGIGVLNGSFFVQGRSFAFAEGALASFILQGFYKKWYTQAYGVYYAVARRRTPEAYDFVFATLQLGLVLNPKLKVGLVLEPLSYARWRRNEGDTNQFSVLRWGMAAALAFPKGVMVEGVGGYMNGIGGQGPFVRLGINRSFAWKSQR